MTNPRDDLMALAPCPFCHGTAYLHEQEGQRPEDTRYSVHCDECDATHDAPSKDAAVAAWNRRAAASRPAPVDREAVVALEKTHAHIFECLKQTKTYSSSQYDNVRPFAVDQYSRAVIHRLILEEWNASLEKAISLLRPAEPVEVKWRPIETAPKEDPECPGRDFEIIVGGGEVKDESADLAPWRPFDSWSLACYDSMRKCWRGEQTEQYDCFYLHKPTHWMPKFAGPGQCGSTTPDAVGEPVATSDIKKIDPEKLYSYNPEAKVEFDREPVAWRYRWKVDGEWTSWRVADHSQKSEGYLSSLEETPLYAHPLAHPCTSAAVLQSHALKQALDTLAEIAAAHIPDCPAHYAGEELAWAQRHVGSLRHKAEIARNGIADAIRQLPTTERGE